MLNSLFVIVWIQLNVVGLRIFSAGLNLAPVYPNMSVIKLNPFEPKGVKVIVP